METGVVNEESLSNILRSISQRKKNGVLEITLAQEQVSILFQKGKVVDVHRTGRQPAEAVVSRLQRAGWIPPEVTLPLESYTAAFMQLGSMQLPRGPIGSDMYRRVVKHYVLDELYSLDMGAGAYYTFKVQMVEADREFAPSISSGQILLDLVSLRQDMARFVDAFPPGSTIEQAENGGGFSEEDELIWAELAGGATGIEKIADQVMLSRFHFQDAMLGMLERGAIRVVNLAADAELGELEDSSAPAPSLALDAAQTVAAVEQISTKASDYHALHNKLLQDVRIPYLLILVALVVGLLGPIICWGGTWGVF